MSLKVKGVVAIAILSLSLVFLMPVVPGQTSESSCEDWSPHPNRPPPSAHNVTQLTFLRRCGDFGEGIFSYTYDTRYFGSISFFALNLGAVSGGSCVGFKTSGYWWSWSRNVTCSAEGIYLQGSDAINLNEFYPVSLKAPALSGPVHISRLTIDLPASLTFTFTDWPYLANSTTATVCYREIGTRVCQAFTDSSSLPAMDSGSRYNVTFSGLNMTVPVHWEWTFGFRVGTSTPGVSSVIVNVDGGRLQKWFLAM